MEAVGRFGVKAHNRLTVEREQANVSAEKLLKTEKWILTQLLLWDQGDPDGVMDKNYGTEGGAHL